MKNDISISTLKNPSFKDNYNKLSKIYKKLLCEKNLSTRESKKILALAIILLSSDDENAKKLGYRIILLYCNFTKDFIPLYDVTINTGLAPVASLIKRATDTHISAEKNKESFISEISESYLESLTRNGVTLTEQQFLLQEFSNNHISDTLTIIAPTSYGKSELIAKIINRSDKKRICIIVPSKALLAQTRRLITAENKQKPIRIVIHPEMHIPNNKDFIYLLTQERLSRILSSDPSMSFELVIIDEAHNLIEADSRSTLLASTLRILYHRNKKTAFKFITPFLCNADTIRIRGCSHEISAFSVSEYVKSEIIHVADFRNKTKSSYIYDQFLNEHYHISNQSNTTIEYIKENALEKNIIYLNRPIDIQSFALKLSLSLTKTISGALHSAIKEISTSMHPEYLLLKCMQHGVLYHHGSMADNIRNYVEHLYRTCGNIRFMISNSTLLEGVNLPIERLFMLSLNKGTSYLTPPQLKNLIGRVSRFGDVFSGSSTNLLRKLQPQIHIAATLPYISAKANIPTFLKTKFSITQKIDDKPQNVLLANTEINDNNRAQYYSSMTRLRNLEPDMIHETHFPKVATAAGKRLLENHADEIDTFKHEQTIQTAIDEEIRRNGQIHDPERLMRTIADVFIFHIPDTKKHKHNNIIRLKNTEAQKFYTILLEWRINSTPIPVMIAKFVRYWKKRGIDELVFVGKWGDTEKENSHAKNYTRIRGKTDSELINLAIVRIKEEEEFLDNHIFKFIEVLNSLNALDSNFYTLCKYGTGDQNAIQLIKNGFSRGVADLLLTNYSKYIKFNNDGTVTISSKIHHAMKIDQVSFMNRHEIETCVPT